MCALLLRDSDSLTSFRVTALLHMMLCSAEAMRESHLATPKSKNNTVSKEWQGLQEVIFSSLPKLIHRYRDSVSNLELLLQLYSMYEHRHIPPEFFKSIMEVYDVTTEDSCLQIISNLLRTWHETSASAAVTKHVESLLNKQWGQIQACHDSIFTFCQREREAPSKQRTKRSSKGGPMKVRVVYKYFRIILIDWRCTAFSISYYAKILVVMAVS